MKVSIEILYHMDCDYCKKWWSYGDIPVKIDQPILCPHCSQLNSVKQIVNGKAEEVERVAWVKKTVEDCTELSPEDAKKMRSIILDRSKPGTPNF